MRIEESVVTNRPVEEVYLYASNPENLLEWARTAVQVRRDAPEPLKAGATFTAVGEFLGRRIETAFEVVTPEFNRCHSHRSTGGPFPTEWVLTFEEIVWGGTRYTQVVEGEPGRFVGLATGLLERVRRPSSRDTGTTEARRHQTAPGSLQ
jgi:hypothetical protein